MIDSQVMESFQEKVTCSEVVVVFRNWKGKTSEARYIFRNLKRAEFK